jgi:hypothetical protein
MATLHARTLHAPFTPSRKNWQKRNSFGASLRNVELEQVPRHNFVNSFFCREQVVNVDLHDVFYLDSLPSSHPISTIIDNPTYQDNFDRISYGKGSVLIRMIEDFLTTDVFFKALGNYFKVMTLLDSYKNIFISWTIILYHSSPKAYYYELLKNLFPRGVCAIEIQLSESGSGSGGCVCFRAFRIQIRNYFVRIRIQIFPPTSKIINTNLDFCLLMTFYL